ncbi:MAG TPA: OmpA family protein [Kofleriaceae bacterium]|jgi:outer membrane protein OmpA-like peptidoglycan-associated protein
MKPIKFVLIASVLLATTVAAADHDTTTAKPWFKQDSLMMRTENTLLGRDSAPDKQAKLGTTLEVVPFAFDSARVDFDLTNVAEQLRKDPTKTVVLDGYADPTGSSTYNVALSLRRAEGVRDRLVRLGVDEHRIVLGVFGEDGPRGASYSADRNVTIRTSTASVKQIVDNRLDPATAVIFGKAIPETAFNETTNVNGLERI